MKAFRGRDAIIHPPVPIRPLVIVDLLIGGLQLLVGVAILVIFSRTPGPRGGANVPLAAAFLGGVIVFVSAIVITMGLLLFTRKPWAYWISLIGHTILFLLQTLGLVGALLQTVSGSLRGGELAMQLGCNGFMLLLFGLCVYHAWKLIQADKKRTAKIRLAAEEPEMEIAPGWDEGPRQR